MFISHSRYILNQETIFSFISVLDLNNSLIMAELMSEHVLLGMGNPLLDISATVKTDLLTKHNLKVVIPSFSIEIIKRIRQTTPS